MNVIDFETRSKANLKKVGGSKYASDPSTSVLCLGITDRIGSYLWKPGDPPPARLIRAIERGELIYAHNAFFERNIWHYICHRQYGWPDVPADNWRCTLAMCSRMALPRNLQDAGSALGLKVQKDAEGHKVMLQLSKPRKPTKKDPSVWVDDEAKFRRMYDYCMRDIETQDEVARTVPDLPDRELRAWQLDQKINLRGVFIDMEAVEHARDLVDQIQRRAANRLWILSDGKVQTPTQVKAIRDFLKEHGLDLPNLKEPTVTEYLKDDAQRVRDIVDDEDDAELCIETLQIRRAAGKASTGKLEAMVARVEMDGRVREILRYHGAHTGRWAGLGIQIQNFPRGTFPEEAAKACIDFMHQILRLRDVDKIAVVLGDPLAALASTLRSMIRAEPGNRLLVSDFAQIEARVLAWLAGCEEQLALFRAGADPYKGLAADIYDVELDDVTKKQRQVGKTAVLGLGYGMGPGSRRSPGFRGAMKSMTGRTIDRKLSRRVVKMYRDKFPEIRLFWRQLNEAAIASIDQPGERFEVDNGYTVLTLFCEDDKLKILLPSGRCLHYWNPSLVKVRAPWSEGYKGRIRADKDARDFLENLDIKLGKHFRGWFVDCDIPKGVLAELRRGLGNGSFVVEEKEPQYVQQIEFSCVKGAAKKWKRDRTYGGKLAENVTQAIARDFMLDAMFRVDDAGYSITMTVHDEVAAEDPEDFGSLEEFDYLMSIVPDWGTGCPIEVEGYEAERYKK